LMRLTTCLIVSGLAASLLLASSTHAQHNPNAPHKQMRALQISNGAVRLDGRLDDPIWAQAEKVNDFLQKEPVENGTPSGRTEVAIAYDDDAVYVGARMFCKNPEKLAMYLDRHDNQGPAEQFIVTFDSYHDHRTAYGFGVNVAGVRFDRYNSSDNEFDRDFSYNPVWEAVTSRDSVSWSCEMRIPFSQLRFNDQPVQTWGVQFNRWIPGSFEDIFWVVIPRNATGFSSWFGEMSGIENVKPSRRLELMPYAASNASMIPRPAANDPLHDRTTLDQRIGGDLKMGLGPNMTLDATINPDFGQVEADPAVINLSAYETSFSERRPFFSEGIDLLHPEGPGYFYSRRIGGPPHGSAAGHFVKSPENATILGAAKISGRVTSKTSLGVLAAVTGREKATSHNVATDSTLAETFKTVIEPPTAYGLAAIRREFGGNGSTVGLLLTGMGRNFSSCPDLKQTLRSQAYAGNFDWNVRFEQGKYDIVGFAGFSHVRGDAAAMTLTQRSSVHYFQRPDAQSYVKVDSTRTAMTGFTAQVRGGKRSGTHWLWGGGANIESPDFELNDAGILESADDISQWAHLTYRETTPGRLFHSYLFEIDWNGAWNFSGTNTGKEVYLYGNLTFKSFSSVEVSLAEYPAVFKDDMTRGGPLMKRLEQRTISVGASSPHGRSTHFAIGSEYTWADQGGSYYEIELSHSRRIGSRVSLEIVPQWEEGCDPQQWFGQAGSGSAATYGTRYIFGALRFSEARLGMRLNYFFSPTLSLEVYAEPFAAAGKYSDIGELVAGRSSDLRKYGTDGTTIEWVADSSKYRVTDGSYLFWLSGRDYGDRSFRSNVVLRWEFARGSTAYLVWQRNRGTEREPGRQVRFASLGDAFAAEGSDYVALKISYWIPVR
jgi:hypothetical protein